jgi:hypothetical protein
MTFKAGGFGQNVPYWARQTEDRQRRQQTGSLRLKAHDKKRNIIHDIPDCEIISGMQYGGHIYFDPAGSYVSQIIETTTSTASSATIASAITNVDLSAKVPSDLANLSGIMVYFSIGGDLSDDKSQAGAELSALASFSLTYNSDPSSNNRFAGHTARSQGTEQLRSFSGGMAFLPVVYNDDTPYITWELTGNIDGMATANGTFYLYCTLYLQGFLA